MNRKTIESFVHQINLQYVEGIYSLMTDDHVFIDNIGNKFEGKEMMREAWKGYFSMFPDYKITVTESMEDGNDMLLCGIAEGTYKNHKEKDAHFKIPAAWKAIVENGKIKLWQVFADTKVQFDVMEKYK
jgi:ketosteroid isomerase-like protein